MIFAARICSLFFGAVAAAGVACAAPAGNPDLDVARVELAPHRAVYDLRLAQSRNSRSAEGGDGAHPLRFLRQLLRWLCTCSSAKYPS